MEIRTRGDLSRIAEKSGRKFLSVYLSPEVAGPPTRKNPLLLREALSKLEPALTIEERKGHQGWEAAWKLIEDHSFWQNQRPGLGLFLSPDGLYYYRSPRAFTPYLAVDSDFHLWPVREILEALSEHLILSLSLNQIRLFQGGLQELTEVSLPADVPKAIQDVYDTDAFDDEGTLQYHSGNSAYRGASQGIRPANFHGQISNEQYRKELSDGFLRKLSDTLLPELNERKLPLILFGTSFICRQFRNLCDYPHIAEKMIEGNADHLSKAEIHQRLRSLLEELYSSHILAEHRRFEAERGAKKTLESPEEIIKAAPQGAVDTLFLNETYVKERTFPKTLQTAAHETERKGGRVYLLPREKMPHPSYQSAAILRFPVRTRTTG